jgi:hypothetical protein
MHQNQKVRHFAAGLALILIPAQNGFALAAELLAAESIASGAFRTIDSAAATAEEGGLGHASDEKRIGLAHAPAAFAFACPTSAPN